MSSLGRSSKATYIALRITELTSIPLFALLVLYIVSGYGILNPLVVEVLTGLSYTEALRLHTSPVIRVAFIATAITHTYAGFIVLINRRVGKYVKLSTILTGLITAITTYILGLTILAEITK